MARRTQSTQVGDRDWVATIGDGSNVIGLHGDAVALGVAPDVGARVAAGALAPLTDHPLTITPVFSLVVGTRAALACCFTPT